MNDEVTTPTIDRSRAWVEAGVDHTINTGNFENFKLHFVYGRPLQDGENPGEALQAVFQALCKELVDAATEVKSDLGV